MPPLNSLVGGGPSLLARRVNSYSDSCSATAREWSVVVLWGYDDTTSPLPEEQDDDCALQEMQVTSSSAVSVVVYLHRVCNQQYFVWVSRVSSGSVVSDYGLDDRATAVRSPAEAKDFSSNLCVQTGSGAHPASCTMGTVGRFPGAKRGRGVTLTFHLQLVPRSRMSRSYTSSPPKRHHGV
jgi:hypothetical protein